MARFIGTAYTPLTEQESATVNASHTQPNYYSPSNPPPVNPSYSDAQFNTLLASKNYVINGHNHDTRYSQVQHAHNYAAVGHSHGPYYHIKFGVTTQRLALNNTERMRILTTGINGAILLSQLERAYNDNTEIGFFDNQNYSTYGMTSSNLTRLRNNMNTLWNPLVDIIINRPAVVGITAGGIAPIVHHNSSFYIS